jgi:ATP-binding protein involved in chromosome partitioning
MLSTQPTVIERSVPRQVKIEWADGVTSAFSAADLRRVCPCAACVSEATGLRTHDPATVSDDLEQNNLHLVGNYAVSMQFSDGHSTGIFTFQFLRRLDEQRGKP